MSTPYIRNTGEGGEQGAGFILGEAGYIIVAGPSGKGGHPANAPSADGIAFNPANNDLIIYDEKDYLSVGGRNGLFRMRTIDKASALVTGLNERWIQTLLDQVSAADFAGNSALKATVEARLNAVRLAIVDKTRAWPPYTRVAVVRWRGGVVGISSELQNKNIVFIDLLTDAVILQARRDRAHGWPDLIQQLGRVRHALEFNERLHAGQQRDLNRAASGSLQDFIDAYVAAAGRLTHAAMRISFPPMSIWGPARFHIYEAENAAVRGNVLQAVAEVNVAGLYTVLAIRRYQLWEERISQSRRPMELLIGASALAVIGAAMLAYGAANLGAATVASRLGSVAGRATEEAVEIRYRVESMVRVAVEAERQLIRIASESPAMEELVLTAEREIRRLTPR